MISTEINTQELSLAGFHFKHTHYRLSPEQLTQRSLLKNEGALTDSGALAVDTGRFTGRCPKDRYIVRDKISSGRVNWDEVNIPFQPKAFTALFKKMLAYLSEKEIYVRDVKAGAVRQYSLAIKTVCELAYQDLFVHNLFLSGDEEASQKDKWTILAAPGFEADPSADGTRSKNFTIISFVTRTILIGGTGYTGEIKKAVFSVLNFILPLKYNVLPMHCAVNTSMANDTAIYFGLSGTGKTTLSADPKRFLVGDDEHGWDKNFVFNFEGGCYAKCVNLSANKEPGIFHAIRPGALLENTRFYPGTNKVNFEDISVTENTRVAYPVNFIFNAIRPSVADLPKNIFFLTADAFGILPPVSLLSKDQVLYYFLSGYTAKVAGTENGIKEPQATFSACFAKAFLPLSPVHYALLLGEKLEQNPVKVWMINTGWTGGSYGTGKRIKLEYTRAMINAALEGKLDKVGYRKHSLFNLSVPISCPGVPAHILDPESTWENKAAYNKKALELSRLFTENFRQFKGLLPLEVESAGPRPIVAAL